MILGSVHEREYERYLGDILLKFQITGPHNYHATIDCSSTSSRDPTIFVGCRPMFLCAFCLLHHCFGATEEPCKDAPCDFTLRRVADAGIVEGGWGCKSSRSKKTNQGGPRDDRFQWGEMGPP